METQDTNTIDIRGIIQMLLRKWHWFAISCLLCFGLGVLYYFSTTPKFMVDGEVQFRSGEEAVSVPGADMLQMIGLTGNKKIDDEIAIMTSRDIYMQAVKELDLQSSYYHKNGLRWELQYAEGRDLHVEYAEGFLENMRYGVHIDIKVRKKDYVVKVKYNRLFGSQKFVVTDLTQPIETDAGPIYFEINHPLEKGARYRIITYSLLSRAKGYSKSISVMKLKKESSIVRISTTTTTPALAIDFLNKLIELYNTYAVIDKRVKANTTALFIDERLRLIASELETAETEVEQYKKEKNITDVETNVKIYLQESIEYRHKIEELETQMKLVNYIESFILDENNKDQLIPANLGISDESLAQLINRYDDTLLRRMRINRTATSENPVVLQINDQIEVLRSNILSSIQSVKNSLKISKADLESLSRESNKMLAAVPTTEREYVEKVRNKELQQKLYLYLYQKREENALSLIAAVAPANVGVRPQIDPKIVAPRIKFIFLICLIFGCAIPAFILYLQNLLNDKITDRKKFIKYIKVPSIGELLNDPKDEPIVVGDGVDSTASELFRLLRTNLIYIKKTDQKVILVSSSIDHEGKTYVASNLAISFALLGKRVALVDLDLRNPSLAAIFGVSNSTGVTSYLSDIDFASEDITRPSGRMKNLDILPAGPMAINPNELLQSERLDHLFGILRKQYDYIIVDSAPAAMVSDTFVINRLTDLTLFVVRIGVTTIKMTEFANSLVEHQRLNSMVCVLNAANREDLPYDHAYGYTHH